MHRPCWTFSIGLRLCVLPLTQTRCSEKTCTNCLTPSTWMGDMDNRLVHRATVLREWMGTESCALVQAMLKELHAQRMDLLISGTKEQFDQNVGHIMGLTEAIRLAEQTILDEVRQRPR